MTADPKLGAELHALVSRLYGFPRSITGDGVRATLDVVGEHIPLERLEVPSGTRVLDWHVPPEWNVRAGWVKDPAGRVVVDFAEHNLHVMGYSVPLHRRMPLEELQQHLHSLPEHPDAIPWRTSYYSENWGFSLPDRTRQTLPDGEYEVFIDSTLAPGHLSLAQYVLSGDSSDEVLISSHTCHPSLADDNLSGIAVATYAAKLLGARSQRRYTYRFVFAPGTIGSLTWLELHRANLGNIRHGVTLTCLGDGAPFTYKRTFAGDSEVDRAASYVVKQRGDASEVIDYFPFGYDERQYNSPGFRLPVGSLMRGRHGSFPEYHTSADNLDFVRPEYLGESLAVVLEVIEVLEGNIRYQSLAPEGEPQLGRRGLYGAIGAAGDPGAMQMAMLWVLSCADGTLDLLAMAERSGVPFEDLRRAADVLEAHELLRKVEEHGELKR